MIVNPHASIGHHLNTANAGVLIKLHNELDILDYLLSLSGTDRQCLQQSLGWSTSLLGRLAKQDVSLFDMLLKCTEPEKAQLKSMLDWNPSIVANMSKIDINFFAFVLKLPDSERLLFSDMLEWPGSFFEKMRQEPHHLIVMNRMTDVVDDMDSFLQNYFHVSTLLSEDVNVLLDAFSRGQMDSKIWLCDTLSDLKIKLGNTWVLCGWLGTLPYLLMCRKDEFAISNIRSFDIDPKCQQLADTMNRQHVMDKWRFKAATLDVNELQYDHFKFEVVKANGQTSRIKETVDTVINTSCDHMTDDAWWDKIPPGRLVVLQNNNYHGEPDHVNTVSSIDEFSQRYPMSQLLYRGELECKMYTRYMLVGYK